MKALKEFIEVEFIKEMSPEEINDVLNKLHKEVKKLREYRAECEKALGSANLAISNNDTWALPALISELTENLDKLDQS